MPGSRHFRLVCYNAEVTVEPCADFRNEVCIQGDANGFKTAGCRANKWQECVAQKDLKNCMKERRDCIWISESMDEMGDLDFTGEIGGGDLFDNIGGITEGIGEIRNDDEGVCVPRWAPGFNFWGGTETEEKKSQGVIGYLTGLFGGGSKDASLEQAVDASQICGQASTECTVEYEEKLSEGEKKCVKNCECLDEEWEMEMALYCASLGDCGVKTNYQGAKGFNTVDDLFAEPEEVEEEK